jgi:GNAT superfamily N-acetyltransferase
VVVVEAGPDRIAEVEPLWRALYEHHSEISPGMSGVRAFEETWSRRRRQYEEWLAGDDAALLLAEKDGRAVGYAAVTVGPGPATWDIGERVAELETLAVLADERGGGVGAALLDAAREWARARGAEAIGVGFAHTNEGARRFYEREGFAPFYVEMLLDLRTR